MSRPITSGAAMAERFWNKVCPEPNTGCMLWTGAVDRRGYGAFGIDGRQGRVVRAHRWAYESEIGPIQDGLVLDHKCKTPTCVNPMHLEPVTQRENVMRGDGIMARFAAKTTCLRGHPFNEKNTFLPKTGGRLCRACRVIRETARVARKKCAGAA